MGCHEDVILETMESVGYCLSKSNKHWFFLRLYL